MANISQGVKDFLFNALDTLFTNGVGYAYSGQKPASGGNAPPTGTYLGIVTRNGDPFTPGSPTNGLNFDLDSASGELRKPVADVWRLTCTTSGTIGYIRFCGNAADAGTQSTTLPRFDATYGTNNSTAEVKGASAVVEAGQKYSIDSLSLYWLE